MIIQSPFTDYYDYTRKLGIDKSITYKRLTRQLKENGRDPYWSTKYVPKWDKKWIDSSPLCLIEFCGNLYYFIRTEDGFSYEDSDWEPLYKSKMGGFHVSRRWEVPLSEHYKSDAPVIVLLTEYMTSRGESYEREVAYENPRLADFSFGKVVPAEKAYQELMMWFANKKQPPPIPHVDDKTMAEAKGFDKHSFRNSQK